MPVLQPADSVRNIIHVFDVLVQNEGQLQWYYFVQLARLPGQSFSVYQDDEYLS